MAREMLKLYQHPIVRCKIKINQELVQAEKQAYGVIIKQAM